VKHIKGLTKSMPNQASISDTVKGFIQDIKDMFFPS
jgi:hypothetical protein